MCGCNAHAHSCADFELLFSFCEISLTESNEFRRNHLHACCDLKAANTFTGCHCSNHGAKQFCAELFVKSKWHLRLRVITVPSGPQRENRHNNL